MTRVLLVLAVALALLVGAAPSPARAQAAAPSAVAPWIELELDAIAAHATNPPRAARALAHLSRAMYLGALAGAWDRDDAVAGAAATVLPYFYPDRAGAGDALAHRLADVDSRAFAVGRLTGRLLIARAQTDGADAVWTGSPPQGPGYWVPTPPANLPPLEPLAGTWRTWNLGTARSFAPARRRPTAARSSSRR